MRNLVIALLMLAASPALAQDKEKLSATDLTVRTALTFKVSDTVVQKLLPAGFEVNSPTAGPSKGSNLNMTLIDYLMVQDPEGKPLPPRTTVAMSIPAKKTASGEAVAVVFGGFIAVPARGKAEPKIHSAAKPEFYRIYRFEQAADVVRSTATGIDRVSKCSIKATGPKLALLFDGSEQLISITSIPFYSRSIYVPAI